MPPSEPPRAQVEEVARAPLPSRYGEGLIAHAFRDLRDGAEHLALVKGAPGPGALVRVHSECLTGDALGSLRCDCGEQLRSALARIAASEAGVLVYVRGHEGRGIGLANKIAAYAHQDRGLDTVEANAALGFPPDARDYAAAAAILRALGVDDLRLLSNNAAKAAALRAHGLTVREELPLAHDDAAMDQTLLVMTEKRFGCAGVVDGQGRLAGLITDGDLRRHMGGLMDRTAGEVMTRDPLAVAPAMLAAEALGLMNARRITVLFVVEADRPVGILHVHDLLRSGVV